MVESVSANSNSVKNQICVYSAGLVATSTKKSCVQIGKQLWLSHDKVQRTLVLRQRLILGSRGLSLHRTSSWEQVLIFACPDNGLVNGKRFAVPARSWSTR